MAITDSDLDNVRALVLDQAAIVLERNKAYLVESRLTPLATKLGFASLPEFVAQLRREPTTGSHRLVVDAMTTNETYFFRDVHPFDALRTKVLPELIAARAATRTLRIWCGACATGQEPYSIAMLLKERFPLLASWNVSILCTDLSRDVLAKARSGAYTQLEVNRGLPAAMLIKHFVRKGDLWHIREDVRRHGSVPGCDLRPYVRSAGRYCGSHLFPATHSGCLPRVNVQNVFHGVKRPGWPAMTTANFFPLRS